MGGRGEQTGAPGATSSSTPPWAQLPEHLALAVTAGPVPATLPSAAHPWPWMHVTPTAALVDFGEGVRLLVEDGREVTLQWDESSDPTGDPSWLLQGWAVTLAALQRGNLSLHAATVRIGDAVVAIAGNRGAGKSTTAVGLRNRGHQLLVDDVALLEFRGGEAWTTPYARNVHLLPDAAEALGIDFAALMPLALGRDKSAFRAEDPPVEPHRLDLIVVLDPEWNEQDPASADRDGDPGRPDVPLEPGTEALEAENGTGGKDAVGASAGSPGTAVPVVTEARGADRLRALMEHTVRDGLAPMVLGHIPYFTQLARLANAAPVHVVRRPAGAWTLDAVLDAIEELAAGATRPADPGPGDA